MERREVLRMTALMMGGTLTAPLITSVLSGCQDTAIHPNAVLKLFSEDQFFFVKNIVGTILPEGEIPGALAVGVPQMIDHMVAVTYSPRKQMEYLQGLNVTNKLWNNDRQKFSNDSADLQLAFLKKYEIEIKERAKKRAETVFEKQENITVTEDYSVQVEKLEEENLSSDEKYEIADAFFQELKQQTIAYYLSTEEINTKYLNYLPIPGVYQGCISLSEVGGKAWAI